MTTCTCECTCGAAQGIGAAPPLTDDLQHALVRALDATTRGVALNGSGIPSAAARTFGPNTTIEGQ